MQGIENRRMQPVKNVILLVEHCNGTCAFVRKPGVLAGYGNDQCHGALTADGTRILLMCFVLLLRGTAVQNRSLYKKSEQRVNEGQARFCP
jgi:hypothetical protein